VAVAPNPQPHRGRSYPGGRDHLVHALGPTANSSLVTDVISQPDTQNPSGQADEVRSSIAAVTGAVASVKGSREAA
jgi:hypothetical protein